MINLYTIGSIVAFIFIVGIFQFRKRKHDERLLTMTIEKLIDLESKHSKTVVDANTQHFLMIEKSLKDIGQYLLAEDIIGGPIGMQIPMSPTLRVFALTLRQAGSFDWKTYAVPAMTVAEATNMAVRHLGTGWEVIGSSFIDVNVPLPKADPLANNTKIPPTPVEEKKNVQSYASYLQYALENFAKSKAEKEVLSEIISRINKKYGVSTN